MQIFWIVADPLIAFAFLQAFIDILHDYFGTVSSAILKDNFDVVYQVRFHSLHRRPFNPTRVAARRNAGFFRISPHNVSERTT